MDEESKNVSGILLAIKQLQEKNIPFHFTFLSDGNIDQLNKQIEQIKINKKDITVIGEKSIEEVARILQQHHCLVLFSNYENMPCVIAEALCCGIPVIATSVGGIPEIVHNQNGILIPPQDIPQLTNA
ncbi:MAG: glycosyltransferase family 4 protein, partial [Candidatus Bathyarchaeia archaeon]